MILMVIVKLGDINGLSKGYIALNVGHMKLFYNYYTFAWVQKYVYAIHTLLFSE